MTAENAGGTRVPAGELAETRLTVNGSPVVLRLPARVTLADALRDHLGLTGTHLGCEHGICGMCTVLVDGAAARACLLFACQLEGAEVITVEGLGRPGDLHPLQEAFSRHHALQCGFCTPGFLISAYDLLTHRPGVAAGELPGELSGVLCRCTGYRNILAAVGEVARAYRDGLPGPRNCAPGPAPAVGRTGAARPGAAGPASPRPGAAPAPTPPKDPAAAAHAGAPAQEIRLPAGPPAFVIEVASELPAPVADVWRVLSDVRAVARCLPGADLTEELGRDRYRGTAKVAVGPVRLSFAGVAQVTRRDDQARALRVVARGEDAGGSQSQADILLVAEAAGAGSRLTASARVYLAGRIAQFGRALGEDVSRRLFEQFAAAVGQAATGSGSRQPQAAPGTLRLVAAALLARLCAAARRVTRRLG